MSDNNFIIAEEYELPSLGKVYPEKVNPRIRLKSMTTQHELKRLAPSERQYQNLCEILDDCMIDDLGISAYDLCMADFMYVLHKLRVVTYGPLYRVVSSCPICKSERSYDINLDELKVAKYDADNFAELSQFTLPKTGKRIKLTMQTPRMNDEALLREKEIQRKTKGQSTDSAFLFNLQMIIDTVDGQRLDIIKSEDFIRDLPMMDTNYIIQKNQKLVESFGIKQESELHCPICGLDYTSSFRLGQNFFRPDIDD